MLTESTGRAIMDSGDAYGRHWEKNQKKTLEDFQKEPLITGDKKDGDEVISLFHYLIDHAGLTLDDTCDTYNDLPCKDFNSDIYGVSKEQKKYLDEQGFTILDSFNSYNGENYLSQVIQGTYITLDGTNTPDYVLLQVHQGCDVRGGYTDAKMFKLDDGYMIPEVELLDNQNE